ncbi:MAG TPA: hypothetical protein VJ843_03420 [Candidatus Saccharimonadales bacterium]|nr:hypothetical protein [Candidatus Saccharimonadales bacterium]
MKVHFTASRQSLQEDTASLKMIIDAVRAAGSNVARDWLGEAVNAYTDSGVVSEDWATIVKESLGAIAQADVIIAETSHDSFAVGYQIAIAIQQKKPILLLRHKNADRDAFVTGVEDGWVRHGVYDEKNLQEIISGFINENEVQSKDMRFNFFIDRQIYNYLRWASFKSGKTKAEILRELVLHDIERQDYRP